MVCLEIWQRKLFTVLYRKILHCFMGVPLCIAKSYCTLLYKHYYIIQPCSVSQVQIISATVFSKAYDLTLEYYVWDISDRPVLKLYWTHFFEVWNGHPNIETQQSSLLEKFGLHEHWCNSELVPSSWRDYNNKTAIWDWI